LARRSLDAKNRRANETGGACLLRVRIHTPGELLVRLVAIRHREGDARAVRAVLEERAARIRLVLRPAVLTHEAAEVAEALAAAERPEGLLAEVERDRGVLRQWRGERSDNMSEKLERRPVRVVLSNGEIRYEVRAAVYLNGKRKRLRRRFKTVFEAEEFMAETPESDRVRRYKIRDEQYRNAVMQSRSIAGALRLLGVAPEVGNYRVLHRAIERLDLDTSHFAGQSWSRGATVPSRVRPIEDYLSNKYPIQSDRLRRRLGHRRRGSG